MNYQNYEEYMRNVLGYSPYPERNYTYTDAQEDMYTYTDEMPIAERHFIQKYIELYIQWCARLVI